MKSAAESDSRLGSGSVSRSCDLPPRVSGEAPCRGSAEHWHETHEVIEKIKCPSRLYCKTKNCEHYVRDTVLEKDACRMHRGGPCSG